MSTPLNSLLSTNNYASASSSSSSTPPRGEFSIDDRIKNVLALLKHDVVRTPSPSTSKETPRRDNKLECQICRPYSKEDFDARLRTYKIHTWYAKPLVISPLVCARYGWINSGVDKLECQFCNQVICFKADPLLDKQQVETSARDFFQRHVKGGHKPACLFASNPSPESFIDLPSSMVSLKATFQETFVQNVRCFLKSINKDLLPQLSQDFMEQMKQHEEDIATISSYYASELHNLAPDMSNEIPDDDIVKLSFFVALLWWKLEYADNNNNDAVRAACSICQREVLFSTVTPRLSTTAARIISPSMTAAGVRHQQRPIFDPIQEHRWYCPTVVSGGNTSGDDGASIVLSDGKQAEDAQLVGWMRLLNALKRSISAPLLGGKSTDIVMAVHRSLVQSISPQVSIKYMQKRGALEASSHALTLSGTTPRDRPVASPFNIATTTSTTTATAATDAIAKASLTSTEPSAPTTSSAIQDAQPQATPSQQQQKPENNPATTTGDSNSTNPTPASATTSTDESKGGSETQEKSACTTTTTTVSQPQENNTNNSISSSSSSSSSNTNAAVPRPRLLQLLRRSRSPSPTPAAVSITTTNNNAAAAAQQQQQQQQQQATASVGGGGGAAAARGGRGGRGGTAARGGGGIRGKGRGGGRGGLGGQDSNKKHPRNAAANAAANAKRPKQQ